MGNKEKKEHLVKYKLLYTVLILFVYFLGKSLPLYQIDLDSYIHRVVNAESLLLQTITGDMLQCSVFALGISPIMLASILVQVGYSMQKPESKAKNSPKKKYHITLGLTMGFAIVQAIAHVESLQFKVTGQALIVAQVIATIELITGVMIILWLTTRNKAYGIGGQSALIFMNILEGVFATIKNQSIQNLVIPILISILMIAVMLIMENSEKRIPVQRISIHNIYADKNYMAIKLNPIGVMPAMFSTACFLLPQIVVKLLAWIMPENSSMLWLQENMTLTKPLGIAIFVVILYVLTIGLSRVFLNPKEITEQYLKSGDSIVNLHAGRDTRKYLSRTINRMSFLSATVMGICLTMPLILQMTGTMDTTLSSLPSSVMMLTGIWCNLYREGVAIRNLEAYKPFI